MKGDQAGPPDMGLKGLIGRDPEFAQARIDLAELFLAKGEQDSASMHLNAAVATLVRKRSNELEEVDWTSSLARAASLEVELKRLRFSDELFQSAEELDGEYTELIGWARSVAALAPTFAESEAFKAISEKASFLGSSAMPFKLNTAWLLGMKEEDVAKKLGDTRMVEGSGTLKVAGKSVAYDRLLQSGTCLIHNKSVSQEHTDCTLVMFKNGACVAVRSIPGLRMVLKYAPSVQSEDVLGDYLLVPLKDARVKSEKSDFYPFVRWIVSSQSKGGYLVEFTTLESEAWNPTDQSREKNYVLDYFVAKI